jgi:putative tricarboxylic transport membrane protein
MKMDRRIDMAVALGFVLAGLLVIWQATLIKQGVMRDPVGPRAAFYLCGGIMALGGLWVALRNGLALRVGAGILGEAEGTEDTPGHPARFARAAALAGLCFGYALLFNPLGYLIATPLFLLAALRLMGQRQWGWNLLIAVVFTLLAYLVFAKVLGVRMPHGPLTDLFRQLGWITL